MTTYWVIAPYSSDFPEILENVWQYNLSTGVISLGWRELGDISSLNEDELKAVIESTYSDSRGNALTFGMLWNFYHNIRVGDIIIARKGRKRIAAVGEVTRTAFYDQATDKCSCQG